MFFWSQNCKQCPGSQSSGEKNFRFWSSEGRYPGWTRAVPCRLTSGSLLQSPCFGNYVPLWWNISSHSSRRHRQSLFATSGIATGRVVDVAFAIAQGPGSWLPIFRLFPVNSNHFWSIRSPFCRRWQKIKHDKNKNKKSSSSSWEHCGCATAQVHEAPLRRLCLGRFVSRPQESTKPHVGFSCFLAESWNCPAVNVFQVACCFIGTIHGTTLWCQGQINDLKYTGLQSVPEKNMILGIPTKQSYVSGFFLTTGTWSWLTPDVLSSGDTLGDDHTSFRHADGMHRLISGHCLIFCEILWDVYQKKLIPGSQKQPPFKNDFGHRLSATASNQAAWLNAAGSASPTSSEAKRMRRRVKYLGSWLIGRTTEKRGPNRYQPLTVVIHGFSKPVQATVSFRGCDVGHMMNHDISHWSLSILAPRQLSACGWRSTGRHLHILGAPAIRLGINPQVAGPNPTKNHPPSDSLHVQTLLFLQAKDIPSESHEQKWSRQLPPQVVLLVSSYAMHWWGRSGSHHFDHTMRVFEWRSAPLLHQWVILLTALRSRNSSEFWVT